MSFYLNTSYNYTYSFIKENILPVLTTLQKTISAIASKALELLTACFRSSDRKLKGDLYYQHVLGPEKWLELARDKSELSKFGIDYYQFKAAAHKAYDSLPHHIFQISFPPASKEDSEKEADIHAAIDNTDVVVVYLDERLPRQATYKLFQINFRKLEYEQFGNNAGILVRDPHETFAQSKEVNEPGWYTISKKIMFDPSKWEFKKVSSN